jgi:sarcosine oxidase delta subunit
VSVRCPFCDSTRVDAEFVDVGVGMQQVTPYQCGDCLAQQFNPYSDNSAATDEERKVGWWKYPDTESPFASDGLEPTP